MVIETKYYDQPLKSSTRYFLHEQKMFPGNMQFKYYIEL